MLSVLNVNLSTMKAASEQLSQISTNVSNLNTIGYKGNQSQFSALFSQSGNSGHGGASGGVTFSHSINLANGTTVATSNPLDMAVDGHGFFVLQDKNGVLSYTQAGRFEFNDAGVLVSSDKTTKVLGMGSDGTLRELTKAGLAGENAKATEKITLSRVLSTEKHLVSRTVTVYDSIGNAHQLTLEFASDMREENDVLKVPTPANTWTVVVKEGSTVLTATTAATLAFDTTGKIVPNNGSTTTTTIGLNFAPLNANPMALVLDLSKLTSSTATSTLVANADGYTRGTVTDVAVNADGKLAVTFSNGQLDESQAVALALDEHHVLETGDGVIFRAGAGANLTYGSSGGAFGTVHGGVLTGSNTDLTTAFSDIITAQRMYTAGANVNKVVGEMLDSLMQMNR